MTADARAAPVYHLPCAGFAGTQPYHVTICRIVTYNAILQTGTGPMKLIVAGLDLHLPIHYYLTTDCHRHAGKQKHKRIP